MAFRSSGGIGRHAGLKIQWAVMSVRVQVPPRVLKTPVKQCFAGVFDFLLTKDLFYFKNKTRQ